MKDWCRGESDAVPHVAAEASKEVAGARQGLTSFTPWRAQSRPLKVQSAQTVPNMAAPATALSLYLDSLCMVSVCCRACIS